MYKIAHVNMMLLNNNNNKDFEGFGISVLEGNIYGLPAIGAKESGLEDAIKNNYNGELVNPNNIKEVIGSLKNIFMEYDNYVTRSKSYASMNKWDTKINQYENLSNKKKLICTIVSDTPYSNNKNGELVGLDLTVEEIDHLACLFKQVYHFAPFYKNKPPKIIC